MKFDVVLMNPPYDHGLGDKFFNKTLDISDIVITIQPSNWLYGSRQNKNIISKLKNRYVDITSYKYGGSEFGAGFGNELSINYIDSNKKQKIFIDKKEFSDITKIRHYSGNEFIEKFNNTLSSLYRQNNVKQHILEYELGQYVDDDNWCVKIPEIRGHRGNYGVLPDFYTIFSNNEQFVSENSIGKFKNIKIKTNKSDLKYYISFNTKYEAHNFINYCKTYFVRGLLYISKMNTAVANGPTLKYIPWFDFSNKAFSKSPKEIDDYLFKKYNISDDIRKHIEEILPDYYNIR